MIDSISVNGAAIAQVEAVAVLEIDFQHVFEDMTVRTSRSIASDLVIATQF